jgi:hypothetical protein
MLSSEDAHEVDLLLPSLQRHAQPRRFRHAGRKPRRTQGCWWGLHPEPGVYTMHVPPEVDIREGSRWELSCPLCGADLRSDLSEDLCALDMTCGGDPHRVYFSRDRRRTGHVRGHRRGAPQRFRRPHRPLLGAPRPRQLPLTRSSAAVIGHRDTAAGHGVGHGPERLGAPPSQQQRQGPSERVPHHTSRRRSLRLGPRGPSVEMTRVDT